jgi:hypothetical protein
MSKILFVFIVLASLTYAETHSVTPGAGARRIATKISAMSIAKTIEKEDIKAFFAALGKASIPSEDIPEIQEFLAKLPSDKWQEPLKALLYKLINVVPDLKTLKAPLAKIAGKPVDEIVDAIQAKKVALKAHYEKLAGLLGYKDVKQLDELLRDVTKDDEKLYQLVIHMKLYPRAQRAEFAELLKEIQQYNAIDDTETNKTNRKKMLLCLTLASGGKLEIDAGDNELALFASKAYLKIQDYAVKNEKALQENFLDKIAVNDKGEIAVDATAREKFSNLYNQSNPYIFEANGDHLRVLLGKNETAVTTEKAKKLLTYFVNKEGASNSINFIGKTSAGDKILIPVEIEGKLSYDLIIKAYRNAEAVKGVKEIYPVFNLMKHADGEVKINRIKVQ